MTIWRTIVHLTSGIKSIEFLCPEDVSVPNIFIIQLNRKVWQWPSYSFLIVQNLRVKLIRTSQHLETA